MVSIGVDSNDHPTAFYVPQADGSVLATVATRGPWSDDHQHGGPPSALLVRALQRYGETPSEFMLARLTVELLQPVPIAEPLTVHVEPVKLGGQAQRLAARLRLPSGRVVVEATALRIRQRKVELPPARHTPRPSLPSPRDSTPLVFPFFRTPVGYHTAVEVRVAEGAWGQGACSAWLRPRIALVQGEPLTPAQSVAIVADAANGIAMVLDSDAFAFINPDITIAMARRPQSTWVGLRGHALAVSSGTGLNDCGLHDTAGELGRVVQSLVINPRR